MGKWKLLCDCARVFDVRGPSAGFHRGFGISVDVAVFVGAKLMIGQRSCRSEDSRFLTPQCLEAKKIRESA